MKVKIKTPKNMMQKAKTTQLKGRFNNFLAEFKVTQSSLFLDNVIIRPSFVEFKDL
ncbi:hypothetical protein ACWEWB_09980 [Staphylococcus xylosus]|uniref:hypothetical protein n=1 Tax=Staphylococcus xylosus TaxID=1288 RepID=UPI001E532A89|nr:hypothetical protein [Staphylococcus xylosus]